MEQVFQAFGIEWQLLLAQAVNFAIVLAALTYFLYKPVMKLLAEREEKIKRGITDAKEATALRARVLAEKSGIITRAEAEAEKVVGRASEAGKRERESIIRAGEERARVLLADAEARAEELKRHALRESDKEIAKAAVLAAEKILRKS